MELNIGMTRGPKRHRSKHRHIDLSINMAKKEWACRSKNTNVTPQTPKGLKHEKDISKYL